MNRVQRLQANLNKNSNLPQIFITSPINLNYLSNLNCFDAETNKAYAYINNREALLFVSPLIYGQIKDIPSFKVVNLKKTSDLFSILNKILIPHQPLAFEANYLRWQSWQKITKMLHVKLLPTLSLVEDIRLIKEDGEIKNIKKACQITKKAFKFIKNSVKSGSSEQQVSWLMEKYFHEHGAEGLAFPIIVASGPNSAIPHYQTGKRKIKANDIIIIDAGCKVNGYCSDMTRTFFVGKPKSEWLKVYDIVKKTQQKTIDYVNAGLLHKASAKPGVYILAKNIDRVCRNYIKNQGYGEKFIHSTGHGIGLEVHEEPRISPKSKTRLKKGMVFTIEPGIYLPGKLGVRIEDVVIYH